MSRPSLSVLALLFLSCGGKDEVAPNDPADTDTDADTDADTDTDTVTGTSGIATRPANPTCVAPEPPLAAGQARLEKVFPSLANFSSATSLVQAPGDPSRWYVTTQDGRVWRFDDDPAVATASLVLDVRSEVLAFGDAGAGSNEQGLLGLAFHPDFQNNGYIFLAYTAAGPENRYTRYTSSDGGASFDPASAEVILSIDDPFSNHNGGWLEFGPDGLLYIGTGDGGSGGDPAERAQNRNELLGKFLRIDVDNPANGEPYGIPADNPYASGGGRPEIYAIGLRNPYRFHFDPVSGDLYAGDVGQDSAEEVDRIELGGNYGWDVVEGDLCHEPENGCDRGGLVPPLASYEHTSGSKSVIGGVVYHGSAVPALEGVYLFSDYYDNTVFGLTYDPVTGAPVSYTVLPDAGVSIGHWATGDDGEAYALSYSSGIYRLEPTGDVVDTFPQTLSATGCVQALDPWEPYDGMIPYDLNHPFWSDGADKGRWMAIPDGTTLTVDADGDWEFPIGTVLLKRFEKDGQRIETRLMMRHPNGNWGGYSYQWRADGTDADLTTTAVAVALPAQSWTIPSRAECLQCHTVPAGGSLGLETRQMNTAFTYPSGITANQISTLDHIGWFEASPGDPATLGAFVARDDGAASDEALARTWLHVNCSSCHQPEGPTPSDLDLRIDTALADSHLCDEPDAGDLGLGAGARILAPGDPALSVLSARIRTRDANAMPPVGSTVVDTEGAALVDAWISGLTSCP